MENVSANRFNQIASNFLHSEVHKMSPTIQLLHEILKFEEIDSVCDVACGAGHLAVSFQNRAHHIVGVDPSENMLAAFSSQAESKGMEVETVQAFAESIPLPDDRFDVVVSRLAAHHFSDIQQAVNEMVRLAKPGGTVGVIDLQGHDDPEIDEFNHALEMLHDPTHVRSYKVKQWKKFFRQAGLEVVTLDTELQERPSGVSVKRWCEIASSGEEAEQQIRKLLQTTPKSFLQSLSIVENNGEFFMPIRTLMIIGKKTG